MNRFFIICCLVFIQSVINSSYAQSNQQADEADRLRWIREVRNYKHDFLARELELTEQQQKQFYTDYDAMEDRILEVNNSTRDLEQKVLDNPKASEVEQEAAARAIFELKSEEGKIELEYFEKFKETLAPAQLLRLKNAERRFTQQLMQHHRRLRKADAARKR